MKHQEEKTKLDRLIESAKNNRFLIPILLIGVIVTGVAAFTKDAKDIVDNVRPFCRHFFAKESDEERLEHWVKFKKQKNQEWIVGFKTNGARFDVRLSPNPDDPGFNVKQILISGYASQHVFGGDGYGLLVYPIDPGKGTFGICTRKGTLLNIDSVYGGEIMSVEGNLLDEKGAYHAGLWYTDDVSLVFDNKTYLIRLNDLRTSFYPDNQPYYDNRQRGCITNYAEIEIRGVSPQPILTNDTPPDWFEADHRH